MGSKSSPPAPVCSHSPDVAVPIDSSVHQVLFRPPGTLVPEGLLFYSWCFLIRHRISELRRPIAVKLCTVITICVNFLMQVQKLGGPPLKIFTIAKIWVDFTQLPTLIANISATTQDIENRKASWTRPIPPAFGEINPVNFGPLSRKFGVWV